MAYVNVAEWKTDQVCEWLKGLDNSVLPYVHSFTNHGVSGQQLLSLRPEDLEHLGVLKLGHQEIILEAVEYLRNFHYELDRENLQLLALRLSCQAHSLHNELSRQTDSKPVTTQTLSDVASVIMAVKPLVRWLDRPPFSGQLEYNEKKVALMKLALEMATCAQRDRFAEKPIEEIRTTCGQLAKLADYIIQDITDPMILQPASLDLATLKKKPGDDLGFYILPSFHGAHQIAEIKFGSAAHQCGKMEEGDEIVQVNYQTVVGWERKNLLELFRESPAEVLLTLKRRPRHTKVYGQIYIKPYRLPSNKKTSYTTRWQHNLPSPRPELLTIPDFTMPLSRHMPKKPSPEPANMLDTVNILDTMIIDSSDSDSEAEPPLSIRLYSAKPRSLVQRRATITGASPTTKHGIDIEQFWKELKHEHNTSFQLRDKAASCAHGLDNVPSTLRPQTCLGIEQSKRRRKVDGQTDDKKVHFQDKSIEPDTCQMEDRNTTPHKTKEDSKTLQKGVEALSMNSGNLSIQSNEAIVNVTNSNNLSDKSVPLDECNNFLKNKTSINKTIKNSKEFSVSNTKERGKLDKSYSTPAYDLTDSDDTEDRKQVLFEHSFGISNHGLNNVPTILIKTDETTVDNFENETKTDDISEPKDSAHLNSGSSVTQKTGNIEKCVIENDDEEAMRVPRKSDELKNFVHNKMMDVNCKGSIGSNESNNECIIFDAHKYEKKSIMGNLNKDREISQNFVGNPASSSEGSEYKYETTSNYAKNICSCSGDGDSALNKSSTASVAPEEDKTQLRVPGQVSLNSVSTQDDVKNITQNIPQVQISSCTNNENIQTADDVILQGPMAQSHRYTEQTKIESSKKLETKLHLTPPDPPPRKYYSKSAVVGGTSDNIARTFENQEDLYTVERPNIHKDSRKSELFVDNHTRNISDHQENRDCFNVYNQYRDKSMELCDETSSVESDQKPSLCMYTNVYMESVNKELRGDKSICDKYEPFAEKFAGSSQGAVEYYRSEPYPRNVDSPDGSSYSKQPQSLDFKAKVSEKDKSLEKGVVNKAMMVARSMGFHGSLSKSSSNSPRSNRKRSALFAKKRNVSVKDVGTGDLEGFLTYRTRGAGGAWAKAWFILKTSSLYRFKAQDSIKADCLIGLTGFTVSRAVEVKSRKYAFKVYHTGTVFYFAADTEDSLSLWVDAINKATLGADNYNRNSALFSETDESDSEHKTISKNSHIQDYKANPDKSFGSLKKVVRKDSGYKDQEISGASLDRKYLRFLGARNQNVPVPTAQFRSYRRVLPTSTPSKKQDSIPNSPDLQMTIAGSTFYGLSASQSATDMSSTTQDMGDYRRTTDRCLGSRNRRPDDLQGFITLEEFMLSQQDEDRIQATRNRSVSPRMTPLTSDHVHVQHRNFCDSGTIAEQFRQSCELTFNNEVISTKNGSNEEVTNSDVSYGYSQNADSLHVQRQLSKDSSSEKADICGEYSRSSIHKKSGECNISQKKKAEDTTNIHQTKPFETMYWKNITNEQKQSTSLCHSKSDIIHNSSRHASMIYEQNPHVCTHRTQLTNHDISKTHDYFSSRNSGNVLDDIKSAPKRFVRTDGYSGSSTDLTSHVSNETLQRAKKEVNVSRKGSFNLTTRRERTSSDKNWLDSLRRTDKKNTNCDKNRLKNAAQYQPPPIPTSPFEQEGMRAAFEMHLDKSDQVQKANRLKSLFSTKCQQKPCTLDLPKDSQKTLLGSPRLHRALFREKCSNQTQQRLSNRSSSQSPGDSGISQCISSFSGHSPSQSHSQSCSSVSSVSDWSPETLSSCSSNASKCGIGHPLCQKGYTNSGRNSLTPPTLPYIPPPTSPPPDYPGLEYPPVFEPGTYSLSDASLLRNRNKSNHNTTQ